MKQKHQCILTLQQHLFVCVNQLRRSGVKDGDTHGFIFNSCKGEQIMTPKELLLATLKCKPTPRPAWIPFAGAYASRLKGYTATEMFQSAR